MDEYVRFLSGQFIFRLVSNVLKNTKMSATLVQGKYT